MPQYPPPGTTRRLRHRRTASGQTDFVLGLIGLLFSFIPIIGVIARPLALLALVFAGLDLSRARSGRATQVRPDRASALAGESGRRAGACSAPPGPARQCGS
jgi:hypothetical protein